MLHPYQLEEAFLQVTFDLRLARFYMWAQTDETVYIAVRVPTGSEQWPLTWLPEIFHKHL